MKYQALIVDDEEIVCRGLSQFVKWAEHNFQVAGTAYSVDEALGLLEKTPIDVVFTDIRMPEKNGFVLLQELAESYPETRAVILSGYSDFSYAREAIRLKAVDYLTKPVNISEMEALLDRLSAEFDKQKRMTEIQLSRMEALLLSAAKGFSEVNVEKYHFPVLDNWYGVRLVLTDRSLCSAEIQEQKEKMKNQIGAVVPEAILIDSDVYEIFGLIPFQKEAETAFFTGMLEQMCSPGGKWVCGLSGAKKGTEALVEAWQEAEQALLSQPGAGNLLSKKEAQDISEPEVMGNVEAFLQGDDTISEIQIYIQKHYAENITLHMLAEKFYLHPNYLSRLFKEKAGKNFVDYLTEVRMEKVKDLLLNTNYKIIEICSMTGYDNPRYFSKVFKQVTGTTPREFREQKCRPVD